MGLFWLIGGVCCCVTVILIPLGIIGIILAASHFYIANEQRRVKNKLSNLIIPKEQAADPIITEPPIEKKLIK